MPDASRLDPILSTRESLNLGIDKFRQVELMGEEGHVLKPFPSVKMMRTMSFSWTQAQTEVGFRFRV